MIKPGMLCEVIGGGLYEGRIVTALEHEYVLVKGQMLDLWLVDVGYEVPAFRNGDVHGGDMKFVREGHMLTSWLKPIEPPSLPEVQDERRERVCSDRE